MPRITFRPFCAKTTPRRRGRTFTLFATILTLLAGLLVLQAPSALADRPAQVFVYRDVTTGDQSATISVYQNGSDPSITGYEYSLDNGVTWQPLDVPPFDGADLQYFATITGLQNGTTYSIIVHALNAEGASDPSVPVQATPGTPDAPSLGIVPFAAGGGGDITFPEPASYGSPISDYQTSAETDDTVNYRELPFSVTDDGQGNRTVTIAVTGLQNGTTYNINVRAKSGFGFGAAGNTQFSPDIKPLAPTDVQGTNPGNGQAEVTFTPSADNGSSPIQYYTVTSHPGDIPAQCDGVNPCVVTGLTNGVDYTFTATATNAGNPAQTSADSEPSPDPVRPFAAPLAPRLTVTSVSYHSATLTFTAAAPNGRPVTTYQYSINGGRTWGNFGNRRSGTLALAPNTKYQLAIRGVNQAGVGARSNVVSIQTTPSALGLPSVRTGTSWAVVSWRRSANDALTLGYTVYAHPGPATCSTYYRGDTACLIGAKAGVRYTYTVVARNRTGGAPQSRASRSVKVAAPRVPKKAPGVVHSLSTGKVTKIKRGGRVTVSGAGFLPYSSVYVAAYGKKGKVVARLMANGRGQIAASVKAPKDKIKRYTFAAFGVTQYGSSKAIGKTLRRK